MPLWAGACGQSQTAADAHGDFCFWPGGLYPPGYISISSGFCLISRGKGISRSSCSLNAPWLRFCLDEGSESSEEEVMAKALPSSSSHRSFSPVPAAPSRQRF